MKCEACNDILKIADAKTCSGCKANYHYQCLRISADNFQKESKTYKNSWKCPQCKGKEKKGDNTPVKPCVSEIGSKNRDTVTDESKPSASTATSSNVSNFQEFKTYIDDRLQIIRDDLLTKLSVLDENIRQIDKNTSGIELSVNNLSLQYDTLIGKVNKMEIEMSAIKTEQEQLKSENFALRNHVSLLEARIDGIENRSRSCNVEIRGIPETDGEELYAIFERICSFLKLKIDKQDIYTLFRSGKKELSSGRIRPIVVIFKNIFPKSDLLRAAKDFNKSCKNAESRLKTDYLHLNLTSQPVYISEQLSQKLKKLLGKSKEAKKKLNYAQCWCYNNNVYLKKERHSDPIVVKCEEDIIKLT